MGAQPHQERGQPPKRGAVRGHPHPNPGRCLPGSLCSPGEGWKGLNLGRVGVRGGLLKMKTKNTDIKKDVATASPPGPCRGAGGRGRDIPARSEKNTWGGRGGGGGKIAKRRPGSRAPRSAPGGAGPAAPRPAPHLVTKSGCPRGRGAAGPGRGGGGASAPSLPRAPRSSCSSPCAHGLPFSPLPAYWKWSAWQFKI